MKNISDEQLRAYFLGKMSGKEAENFEIECALSAESTEQARAVEHELADDYLRGKLSDADARLFKTNYLNTETRFNKFRVAQGLRKMANEQETFVAPLPPKSLRQNLFGGRKIFQLAFGAAILLLILCAIAVYLTNSKVDRSDVAAVKDENELPKIENPAVQNPDGSETQNNVVESQNQKTVPTNSALQNKEANKEANSPQKNSPEIKSVPVPKSLGKTATAMIVKLYPGSVRSEGEQFVTIKPGVENLMMILSPGGESNNFKIYRAVVKTPEDETVFVSPKLKAMSFAIPAEKLQNRTYIILLEGENSQGDFESIDDYTFRVRR